MSRKAVDNLVVRTPLANGIPAIYRGGADFVDRMLAGFDDTLAPIHALVDCIDAHFEPRTAPVDLLREMIGWFGGNPVGEGRRDALLNVFPAWNYVATRDGLRDAVFVLSGHDAEVSDNGGVFIARSEELPPNEAPTVTIVGNITEPAMRNMIQRLTPVHVTVRFE